MFYHCESAKGAAFAEVRDDGINVFHWWEKKKDKSVLVHLYFKYFSLGGKVLIQTYFFKDSWGEYEAVIVYSKF